MIKNLMRRVLLLIVLLSSAWSLPPAFAQTLPALPNIPDISCGPSPGKTLVVGAGGDLQGALHAANPGDTITLANGAIYAGNFVLPPKPGASCITIRPASMTGLPGEGERVNPALHAAAMPKLVSHNADAVLAALADVHHYRFVGIEFRTDAPGSWGLISLGTDTQTVLARIAHHLEFDRVYLNGDTTRSIRRAIALNSASTTIVNSYIHNIREDGGESQAIAGWNGPGPFRIVNNFIEAAGINVLFGGATARIPGLSPSDIEFRRNHVTKRMTWNFYHRDFAGIRYPVKNLLELKHAKRMLIEGNIFERTWVHAQNTAIVFHPLNEPNFNPWTEVADITFVNNIVRHAPLAMSLMGADYLAAGGQGGGPSKGLNRLLIRNNLFDDIGPGVNKEWYNGSDNSQEVGTFTAFHAGSNFVNTTGGPGPTDVTIDHNTVFQQGDIMLVDTVDINATPGGQTRVIRPTFTNNIMRHSFWLTNNHSGVVGAKTFYPGGNTAHYVTALNTAGTTGVLPNQCVDPIFTGNVMTEITTSRHASPASFPPGNFFPATLDDVGFVDRTNGNYRLAVGSPHKNAGTDGKDIGADIDQLMAALAGATSPPPPPPPPPGPTNIAPLSTVTVSSEYPGFGQTGIKAVDGVIDGWPGDYTKEWASNNEGVGAWIRLTWTTPQNTDQIKLYDRPHTVEQITAGTLTFSDGSSVAVGTLPNDGFTPAILTFPPKTVTWVQLTGTAVSATTHYVGLAEFEVY